VVLEDADVVELVQPSEFLQPGGVCRLSAPENAVRPVQLLSGVTAVCWCVDGCRHESQNFRGATVSRLLLLFGIVLHHGFLSLGPNHRRQPSKGKLKHGNRSGSLGHAVCSMAVPVPTFYPMPTRLLRPIWRGSSGTAVQGINK
jgi:hypothetical protein